MNVVGKKITERFVKGDAVYFVGDPLFEGIIEGYAEIDYPKVKLTKTHHAFRDMIGKCVSSYEERWWEKL